MRTLWYISTKCASCVYTNVWTIKVQIFWGGYKIFKNLLISNFKNIWKIFQNVAAFSEYLNFIMKLRHIQDYWTNLAIMINNLSIIFKLQKKNPTYQAEVSLGFMRKRIICNTIKYYKSHFLFLHRRAIQERKVGQDILSIIFSRFTKD